MVSCFSFSRSVLVAVGAAFFLSAPRRRALRQKRTFRADFLGQIPPDSRAGRGGVAQEQDDRLIPRLECARLDGGLLPGPTITAAIYAYMISGDRRQRAERNPSASIPLAPRLCPDPRPPTPPSSLPRSLPGRLRLSDLTRPDQPRRPDDGQRFRVSPAPPRRRPLRPALAVPSPRPSCLSHAQTRLPPRPLPRRPRPTQPSRLSQLDIS